MNETTQQEKTTQLGSRNETTQLVSRNETTQLNRRKQLNSSVGTKQLNSALPSTACNRLQRLQPPTTAYKPPAPPFYSRIGFFYLLRSRASSKHLSSHLPVGSLDSSGVKQGLRWIGNCTCGRRIYKETDTRCCCCFRNVTLQLSPSLMELFR
ncbi:hypothetical protein TNCV_6071 [Trichonephila clavipes]|nr:hypothetical protein TNCV_6071 [Trichonephila clavipes]